MIPIVTGERRKAKTEQTTSKKKYRKKSTDTARLCADDVMNRVRLKEYQNTYAEQMAKYGLQRGVDGSEAKHISTSQYYRDLLTQSESIQENIIKLLEQKEQAEQELSSVKANIKKEKLKNSAADVGVTLLDGVGSLFGSNKTRMEKEQMKQRISDFKNQAEERERHIKQMEQEYKVEQSKFTEYFNKVKRYFPYVEKLLPLIDYCRNTMNFSDAIIGELCKFKKVPLKGRFYSSEFNRKFQAENAIFSFEEDKNRKENFQICVNGSSLAQWFRIKMNEWRENLELSDAKKMKGVKF